MSYGCRYCKYNEKKGEECCTLTNKPTNGDVKCDFGYEDCAEYKAAQEPIKPAEKPKLIQTSLFGVVGEKPFPG